MNTKTQQESRISDDLRAASEFFKRGEFEEIEWHDKQVGDYIQLHKKQIIALKKLTDNENLYVGYGGGARGGKSIVGCLWILLNCFAYPETRWLIGRSELKNLRMTTLVTLKSLMSSFSLSEGKDYHYNRVDHIITFSNNSQIILKDTAYAPSDELALKYGSLEITGAFIDESNETSLRIINVIFSRCGNFLNDKYGLSAKVLETFNPSKNHVHSRYWVPYRDNKMEAPVYFIQALAKDNPSPQAQQYVLNIIASKDEVMIERLVKGNFDYDNDPRTLCPQNKIDDLFQNTHILTDYEAERYMCADIATRGNDLFVIDIWLGLVLVHHEEIPKSTGGQIIKRLIELKNEWGIPNSNIVVDADGIGAFIGGTEEEDAFLPGIREFHANQRPENEENYENLTTQCGYKLAQLVNKNKMYFKAPIDKQAKSEIKQELGQLKDAMKVDSKKKQLIKKSEIKENIGRSPDRMDALKLRAWIELKPVYAEASKVRTASF